MEGIRNFKYYSLFRNIFKFEVFYKVVILFILSPILRRILQEYLDSVTYGIAFNQDIIYQFLSFKGIVICLFLFILMIFIIYYEIYVVMNIIAINKENKKGLRERITRVCPLDFKWRPPMKVTFLLLP